MVERLGELTRSYWPVVVALAMVAAGWGASNQQNAAMTDGLKLLSGKIDGLVVDVATVKANTIYRDQEIAELRERMRAVERRR